MNNRLVNRRCFTPIVLYAGSLYAKVFLLFCVVVGLSGCATSQNSLRLAPSPPEVRFSTLYSDQRSEEDERHLIDPKNDDKKFSARDVLITASGLKIDPRQPAEAAYEKKEPEGRACGVKDRFDREAVLAYEWDRQRLALDVDGVELGGDGDFAFRLEWKLRLQPEKTKKQKCRYNSAWQGLIGSGYNELFIREEDTVYEEFRDMRKKMQRYLE